MRKKLYITLSSILILVACSIENKMGPETIDRPIEISFFVDGFSRGAGASRATNEGSETERQIGNLYLFLFDQTGANPVTYFIDNATFVGGTWNAALKKVTLDMTQTQAGQRQVCVVANIDATMRTALDGVTTLSGLQTVYTATAQPWSPHISPPLLMFGSKSHNFLSNHLLDNIPLIRTVAKLELNIALSEKFQTTPVITAGNLQEFKYRYVDFDKNSYVVKPTTKPDNLVASSTDAWPQIAGWTLWGSLLNVFPIPDVGTGYTVGSNGKVTELRIITYLNERDAAGATVEIALPRADNGMLPPPEFGPELYQLSLSEKILRNHWYKYDIEM